MHQQILFIHGGGDTGYQADAALVKSLSKLLGNAYNIQYPVIKADKTAPDFGWLNQIGQQLDKADNGLIIVAHSFGASMLLKYLSEQTTAIIIKGIFLLATPYWEGKEDWEKPLMLAPDFSNKLPLKTPVYFYHSKDDTEVPVSHFEIYQEKVKGATFRSLKSGGHQLDNDLSAVAMDIRKLGEGQKAPANESI